jgi:putrescine aminotransferase
VLASAFAYEELNRDPLMHTSTFSGNPLACAAANATIDVFRKQNVVGVAQELGYKLKPIVERLKTGPFAPIIREVRALGLLIGIEFEAEFLAGDFMVEMLKHKVLVSYSLNAHRVVRLTPPAFLAEADISWLDHALQESSIAISVRYF